MQRQPPQLVAGKETDSLLQVYLLGSVDFRAALGLQQRLAYEVSGNRSTAALLLCEHPLIVTIGREGSWSHLRSGPEELRARRWPVRWINRGGGCWLQVPGQLAIYPILPLDRLGLSLRDYLQRLQAVLIALLDDFSIRAEKGGRSADLHVGPRSIAGVGVAVRDWVSYFGAALNVNPDLELFRDLFTSTALGGPATSLERERHGPLRPALVRERLLEHFAAGFHFGQTRVLFEHPSLKRKACSDAVATPS
jgi:lipoyl(octanoyl) transferase